MVPAENTGPSWMPDFTGDRAQEISGCASSTPQPSPDAPSAATAPRCARRASAVSAPSRPPSARPGCRDRRSARSRSCRVDRSQLADLVRHAASGTELAPRVAARLMCRKPTACRPGCRADRTQRCPAGAAGRPGAIPPAARRGARPHSQDFAPTKAQVPPRGNQRSAGHCWRPRHAQLRRSQVSPTLIAEPTQP